MKPSDSEVSLVVSHSELCIDSRLLAIHMGIKHKNALETIGKYDEQFRGFGKVAFQTEPLPSGQKEKFALLNEDQSFLLLSLSRNTDRVVTAQMIAAAAMRGSADHKEGYAKAKAALGGLESLVKVGAEERVAPP